MADKTFKLSVSASDLANAITKANAAAPQSTTYTKTQVDASQASQDARISSLEDKISILDTVVEHYGLKIDKNNSDTSARITYLYDAVNFTPAKMNYTTGEFEPGSWLGAFFVRNNYPVMLKNDGTEDYRLDPNDHTKKLDGTPSDIANLDYAGNAFSCFNCHIWMKFYEDDDYCYVEVSNYKLDDDFVDYPYIRENGLHDEKLYYPMYEGYVDSNQRLRSISGVKASSNYTTEQEVTFAQNNGSIWSIESWSYHVWFHILAMLISKNYNSQVAFGNGNTSGGSSAADFKENGLLNDKGQFYGYATSTDPVKIFYVENPYANRWSRCLGLYNDNGTYKIKMTPPYTYDETFSGYETIASPTVPASNGYARDFAFSKTFSLLPKSIGGSATTYVGDYFYANNSQVDLALVGGYCSYGAFCGSWCVNVNNRASLRYWAVGASLYLK